ncbi:tyrosine-protein phosphatase [Nesterenkonia alba]|uniref:tyrosine-protein phosphatase n=1 Tax=Nesterenkonia alba TaxID=515814 RepID=UPI00146D70DF|nr:tyrosine-protein phosphatase [Nesterenkonia alba]
MTTQRSGLGSPGAAQPEGSPGVGGQPGSTAQPLANLRDLGGTRVDGGVLRTRTLWRGDDPTLSPAQEIAALASQGLTAVLDLRSTGERRVSPLAAAQRHRIAHHHLPLAEAAVHPLNLVNIAHTMRTPRDVGRWYAELVRSHRHEVVEALRLLTASEGGVLFHCAAGKDRTGILAAVILSVLGAEREVIIADYAATQENTEAIFARLRRAAYAQAKDHPADEDAARAATFFASNHPLLSAAADNMDSMLQELGGQGGVLDLIATEDDPDAISEQLRGKLVE